MACAYLSFEDVCVLGQATGGIELATWCLAHLCVSKHLGRTSDAMRLLTPEDKSTLKREVSVYGRTEYINSGCIVSCQRLFRRVPKGHSAQRRGLCDVSPQKSTELRPL